MVTHGGQVTLDVATCDESVRHGGAELAFVGFRRILLEYDVLTPSERGGRLQAIDDVLGVVIVGVRSLI